MMNKIDIILTLMMWIFLGMSTAYVGIRKGRNPYIWFGVGILLGIIGLLISLFIPKKKGAETLPVKESRPPEIKTVEPLEKIVDPAVPLKEEVKYESKQWYYYDSNKSQQGPINFNDFKRLYESKEIQPDSFIWCEGMFDWIKLRDFHDLKTGLEST